MKPSRKRLVILLSAALISGGGATAAWMFFRDFNATFLTAWIGLVYVLRSMNLPIRQWLNGYALQHALGESRAQAKNVLFLACPIASAGTGICGLKADLLEELAPVRKLFAILVRENDVKEFERDVDHYSLAAILLSCPLLLPLYLLARHAKNAATATNPTPQLDELFVMVRFGLTAAPVLIVIAGFVVVGMYLRKKVLNVVE